MIASADGHAVLEGRSVPLGHPVDRALLRELRTACDVILVGSSTLVAERYATLLDADQRAHRVAQGLSPHPIVATISRSLDMPHVPLFDEDVPVVVYTEAGGDGPGEIRRLEKVTVEAVVGDLGDGAILCEGGPMLLRELIAAGLVDDLLLTVAPLLGGGAPRTILGGPPFDQPVGMSLQGVQHADDHLFLHYRPGA
ncbi:MAG TPA: dihydrofolate reductase family protein [Baekduia sp.]|nr:dihydrofolate reductase family protein [Baekduia sp.]